MAADLILPAAMWVEKEGAYGNAERRTHFWRQLVNAPGEARSDLWQLMEFSKRFTTDEVWPAELLAANPNYRGKTLFDVLFRNGNVDKFPVTEIPAEYENRESKAFGFYVQKGLVRGIRRIRPRTRPRSGAVRHLSRRPRPALACRQRQGNEVALSRRARSLRQAGQGRASSTAIPTAGPRSSPCPTSRPRNRPTRNSTSGSSPAACWSTGIPAP